MKMMIIDDELAVLKNLKKAIEPAGHHCELFQNPIQALDILKKNHFDLVITDIRMPEMHGIEVLKKVKSFNPEIQVIIFTGFASIDNAIDAVNHGAYAFYCKPLKLDEFLGTILKLENELKSPSIRR